MPPACVPRSLRIRPLTNSSDQASSSSTGKPPITAKVTNCSTHAGKPIFSNVVSATWMSSQPTTR